MTLRVLLTADSVQATVSTTSVPPLAKHVRRMLLHLDANADTGALDTLPDTVDDAEAPPTVPPPDDTDAQDPSPFTGAPGTGFDGTASTAQAHG